MPTDWTEKVRHAITNLEIKSGRVLEPGQALAIIDDVVPWRESWRPMSLPSSTAFRRLGLRRRSDRSRGWFRARAAYAFQGHDQPYKVAPGFAAAWKKARGPAMTEQPAPFFLIVADHDQGFFSVEGPMTDDRPWNNAARHDARDQLRRRIAYAARPARIATRSPSNFSARNTLPAFRRGAS
jgi:hypothetical protein